VDDEITVLIGQRQFKLAGLNVSWLQSNQPFKVCTEFIHSSDFIEFVELPGKQVDLGNRV
jgi:hypothetical protein